MLRTTEPIEEVPPEELASAKPEALLLDVREPEEYAHGHVPGTVNIAQADLAVRLDEVPCDRPVVTVCQTGSRSLRSGQFLKQMGFEDVASLKGGTVTWQSAGQRLSTRPKMSSPPPRIAESEWGHAGLARQG